MYKGGLAFMSCEKALGGYTAREHPTGKDILEISFNDCNANMRGIQWKVVEGQYLHENHATQEQLQIGC